MNIAIALFSPNDIEKFNRQSGEKINKPCLITYINGFVSTTNLAQIPFYQSIGYFITRPYDNDIAGKSRTNNYQESAKKKNLDDNELTSWTLNEAMEIMHCSYTTMKKLIDDNKIKYIKIGRSYRINAKSVCEYFSAKEAQHDK